MDKFNLNLISKYRSELMGFSIIWIWFLHMSYKFPFPISSVQTLGATGVDIFFFVSAIGIYYSYSKNENIIQFYKKRVLRIVPTYLVLAIPYRIYEFFTTETYTGFFEFVQYIAKRVLLIEFWSEASASLWYIPAILFFYLIYPLIYRLFDKNKKISFRISFLSVISILTVFLNFFLAFYDLNRPTDRWLLRIPIFLLGCFVAPYVKDGYKIKKRTALWVVILIVVYGVFNFLNIKTSCLHFGNVLWSTIFNSMIAVPLLVLIPLLFEKFKFNVAKKALSTVGKYTLELYILNEITLGFARNQTENKIIIDIISIVFTLIILAIIIAFKRVKNRIAT